MLKITILACLLTAMAGAIAMIDGASSEDATSSADQASESLSETAIYASGIVEGVTEDIHLRSEHVGIVSDVRVKVGDTVNAGDILIQLDQSRQQQAVALAAARLELATAELERLTNGARVEERDEARALVRAAEARLDQAVRNFGRIEQLREDKAVTQQEFDDYRASVDTTRAELQASKARLDQLEAPARADELRAAQARVAAAEAELRMAEVNLEKTKLLAPRRACVLDVNTRVGELTGPDSPQAILVLSDNSVLRVRAFVEELDAPRITVGMPAQITADGLPGRSYTGTVVAISPGMAAKSLHTGRSAELYDTKVREVLLELSPPSELIIGLRVDVHFDELLAAQSE